MLAAFFYSWSSCKQWSGLEYARADGQHWTSLKSVGSHDSSSLLFVMEGHGLAFCGLLSSGYDCTYCHVIYKLLLWRSLQFHRYGMEQAWLEVMALLQCDMNEEWSQELFQQGNGNKHLTWRSCEQLFRGAICWKLKSLDWMRKFWKLLNIEVMMEVRSCYSKWCSLTLLIGGARTTFDRNGQVCIG